jgi:hypothetical protein
MPLLSKNAMRNTRECHVHAPVKNISTPTPTLPQNMGRESEVRDVLCTKRDAKTLW